MVLDKFDMIIKPSEYIAFVGSSGSGKSTLIGLMERFYDPIEGVISFDGIDLKELDIKQLRQQIGLVSQEPLLFSGTIEENISYGVMN